VYWLFEASHLVCSLAWSQKPAETNVVSGQLPPKTIVTRITATYGGCHQVNCQPEQLPPGIMRFTHHTSCQIQFGISRCGMYKGSRGTVNWTSEIRYNGVFFQGDGKNGEISFYTRDTGRTTFFAKIQLKNVTFQGPNKRGRWTFQSPTPPLPPFDAIVIV